MRKAFVLTSLLLAASSGCASEDGTGNNMNGVSYAGTAGTAGKILALIWAL